MLRAGWESLLLLLLLLEEEAARVETAVIQVMVMAVLPVVSVPPRTLLMIAVGSAYSNVRKKI